MFNASEAARELHHLAASLQQKPHSAAGEALERFMRNARAAAATRRSLDKEDLPVACRHYNGTQDRVPFKIGETTGPKLSSFRGGAGGKHGPPQGCKQHYTMTMRALQKETLPVYYKRCVPPEQRALFGPPAKQPRADPAAAKLPSPNIALLSCGDRHDEALGIALLSISQFAPGARVFLFIDSPPPLLRCQTLPLKISIHDPRSLKMLPDEERYACSSGKFSIAGHPALATLSFVLVLDADVVVLEPLQRLWQLQIDMVRRRNHAAAACPERILARCTHPTYRSAGIAGWCVRPSHIQWPLAGGCRLTP